MRERRPRKADITTPEFQAELETRPATLAEIFAEMDGDHMDSAPLDAVGVGGDMGKTATPQPLGDVDRDLAADSIEYDRATARLQDLKDHIENRRKRDVVMKRYQDEFGHDTQSACLAVLVEILMELRAKR